MEAPIHQKEMIIHRVDVKTATAAYPIIIGEHLLNACRGVLKKYPNVFLLTNRTIFDLYSERFVPELTDGAPSFFCMTIPDGERYKNIETLNDIYETLSLKGLSRDGCVAAFGGGVIGDLAGFAAATYMRGIDYVQIPTTLLAMVDSSIGGKTGINLSKGKNMVGAFHHPRAVFCDLQFLDSLPRRQYNAGMMEVIKYGLIQDEAFYRFILAKREHIADRDRDIVSHLIDRCCQLKAAIVGQDEKDRGIRAILNFGHTLGHALESYTGYGRYLHGEALALGCLVMVRYLEGKGILGKHTSDELEDLLEFFSLPTSLPPDFEIGAIWLHIAHDKKVAYNEPRWVTLKRVGAAVWGQSVDLQSIEQGLRGLRRQ